MNRKDETNDGDERKPPSPKKTADVTITINDAREMAIYMNLFRQEKMPKLDGPLGELLLRKLGRHLALASLYFSARFCAKPDQNGLNKITMHIETGDGAQSSVVEHRKDGAEWRSLVDGKDRPSEDTP